MAIHKGAPCLLKYVQVVVKWRGVSSSAAPSCVSSLTDSGCMMETTARSDKDPKASLRAFQTSHVESFKVHKSKRKVCKHRCNIIWLPHQLDFGKCWPFIRDYLLQNNRPCQSIVNRCFSAIIAGKTSRQGRATRQIATTFSVYVYSSCSPLGI